MEPRNTRSTNDRAQTRHRMKQRRYLAPRSMLADDSPGDSYGSPIQGPTLDNTQGFKLSLENLREAKAVHESNMLTLMSMELLSLTRQKLEPNPEFDRIEAIFYLVWHDPKPGECDEGQRKCEEGKHCNLCKGAISWSWHIVRV